ncbi:MAG TPA: hypothetical protein VNN55_12565 [bacterium]|nr:hypothetical protein [bacterium]
MIHGKTHWTLAAAGLATLMLLGLNTGCGGSDPSAAPAGTAGAVSANAGGTDLSGGWTLNRDLSDAPPPPDSLRMRGHSPRRGAPGDPLAPEDARRPRGMRGRQHGDNADFDGGRRGPRGPMTMTIAQTDSTVTITGPRGHARTLYTDGRAMTPDGPRATEGATVTATWNSDGALVITHTGPRGGRRTETFTISPDAQQLTIVSVMQRRDQTDGRTMKRVFDRSRTSE